MSTFHAYDHNTAELPSNGLQTATKNSRSLSRFKAVRFEEYKMHWGTKNLVASVCDVHRLLPEKFSNANSSNDNIDTIPLDELLLMTVGNEESSNDGHYHYHCYNKETYGSVKWNSDKFVPRLLQDFHSIKCEINRKMKARQLPKPLDVHRLFNKVNEVEKLPDINEGTSGCLTPFSMSSSFNMSLPMPLHTCRTDGYCYCHYNESPSKLWNGKQQNTAAEEAPPVTFGSSEWRCGAAEEINNLNIALEIEVEDVRNPPSSPNRKDLSHIGSAAPCMAPSASKTAPKIQKKSAGRFTVLTLDQGSCSTTPEPTPTPSIASKSRNMSNPFFNYSTTNEVKRRHNSDQAEHFIYSTSENKVLRKSIQEVVSICKSFRPEMRSIVTSESILNAMNWISRFHTEKHPVSPDEITHNMDDSCIRISLERLTQTLQYLHRQESHHMDPNQIGTALGTSVTHLETKEETPSCKVHHYKRHHQSQSMRGTKGRLEGKVKGVTSRIQESMMTVLLTEIEPLERRVSQLLLDSTKKDEEINQLTEAVTILQRTVIDKDQEIQQRNEKIREQNITHNALNSELENIQMSLQQKDAQIGELDSQLMATNSELMFLRRQLQFNTGAGRSRRGCEEKNSFSRVL